MRPAPSHWLFAAALTTSTACLFTTSFDDLSGGGPNDASLDGAGSTGDAAGPGGDDAGNGGDAVTVDGPTDGSVLAPAKCGLGTGGPAMIDAGAFCIDATEVTQAQYLAFLQAKQGDTSGQDALCAWNASYGVSVTCPFTPATTGNLPVTGVDWCDAVAMCRWAGKHLCGLTDGGAGDFPSVNDAVHDEWLAACSNFGDGLHTYPYGTTYVVGDCNNADEDAHAPVAVASMPKCAGALPGLSDMSGNVWEWTAQCDDQSKTSDASATSDLCFFRGGAFDNLPQDTRCGAAVIQVRSFVACSVGFRCCAER